MNHWIGIGRLTKDPDTRMSQGEKGMLVARFGIACDRRFKKEGQQTADFLNCVAFGKTAESIEKYLQKGSKVAICGHIQTGSYEKDGVKHYTTDIVVDEWEFAESKRSQEEVPKMDEGFVNVPEGVDDELPFA